jgi:hypothetical protein
VFEAAHAAAVHRAPPHIGVLRRQHLGFVDARPSMTSLPDRATGMSERDAARSCIYGVQELLHRRRAPARRPRQEVVRERGKSHDQWQDSALTSRSRAWDSSRSRRRVA